ncbi:MAG TPA: hypothetical protein VNT53_05120 [Pseudolysinimonas sp.]|nr:hypothetical protein [Pseudolysinimonas sp.]
MPRIAGLAAAAAIVAATGVVLIPAAPAFALCDSSISVECQPANLPILIEAGVVDVTAGGSVVTGAMAGSTLATGAVAAATMTPAATSAGFLGMTMAVAGAGAVAAGAVTIAGAFTAHDVSGLQILTSPSAGGVADSTLTAVNGSFTLRLKHPGVYAGNDYFCANVMPAGSNYNGKFVATFTDGTTFSISTAYPGIAYGGNGLGCVYSATPSENWVMALFLPAGKHLAGVNGQPLVNSVAGRITGQVRSVVSCADGTGTTSHTSDVRSVDVKAGDPIPVPEVSCGKALLVDAYVEWLPAGATSWIRVTNPLDLPNSYLQMPTLYPECFGPQAQSCALTLWKVNPDGTLATCGQTGTFCEGWAADPNVSLNYKCKYGDHSIDIKYCSAYRAPGVGVLPNFGPDPDHPNEMIPLEVTAPIPTTLQKPVDPVTGLPVTSDDPGTVSEQCFPTGWGVVNPLSWVFMPVGCALRAAFIPSPTVLTKVQTEMADAAEGTSVKQVSDLVISIPTMIPSGPAQCEGPAVTFGSEFAVFKMSGTYHPFQVCTGPGATAASWSKIILTAVLAVAALGALTRYIGNQFGFPGFGGGQSAPTS